VLLSGRPWCLKRRDLSCLLDVRATCPLDESMSLRAACCASDRVVRVLVQLVIEVAAPLLHLRLTVVLRRVAKHDLHINHSLRLLLHQT